MSTASLWLAAMKTRFLIPAVLRKYSDDELEISYDGNTVGDLLSELRRISPTVYQCICDETGRMRPHINLFLDNKILRRNNFEQKLEPGVVVSVFQAVSGG
ncbi:MAG: MoaD/ThiS family protein [Planctomycetaceae bacterium]